MQYVTCVRRTNVQSSIFSTRIVPFISREAPRLVRSPSIDRALSLFLRVLAAAFASLLGCWEVPDCKG